MSKEARRSILLTAMGVITAVIMSLSFSFAAEPDIEWGQYQGNSDNNGVVNVEGPSRYEETAMKFGKQLVQGYTTSFTPPLIIDGYIYTASNNKVYKIEKATGDIKDESEELLASVNYAMHPMAYDKDNDHLYVQLLGGRVQCIRRSDLELIWSSKEYPYCQALSPIMYRDGKVYTGVWETEIKNGYYFCLDAKTGETLWEFKPADAGDSPRGFYWAGAYVTDKYLIVGSDDGENNTFSEDSDAYPSTAVLYSLSTDKNVPKSRRVIDKITGIKGDIRSSVVHHNGYVYFTSKGGMLYKVKLNPDGSFDKSTISRYESRFKLDGEVYVFDDSKGAASANQIYGMMTASPVVHNGRIYVGAAGKGGQFSADGGHMFYVLNDDEKLSQSSLAYHVDIPGYPQAAPLVSTATDEEGKVRIYFTYNAFPGGIYCLEDRPGQTSGEPFILFRPEIAMRQYCISPLCIDREGTLYIKNDSGYMLAAAISRAYADNISVTYDDTELFWKEPFEKSILTYGLKAPNGAKNVDVKVTVPDSATSVTIDGQAYSGGKKSISIHDDGTPIKVKVSKTLEGKTYSRTYELTVSTLSNDASLSGLVIRKKGTNNPRDFKNDKVDARGATKPETQKDNGKIFARTDIGYDPSYERGIYQYVSKTITYRDEYVNVFAQRTEKDAKISVIPVANVGNTSGSAAGNINAAGEIVPNTSYDENSGYRYPVYFVKGKNSAEIKIVVTSPSGLVTDTYDVTLVRANDTLDVGREPLLLYHSDGTTQGQITLYRYGAQSSENIIAKYSDKDVTTECEWESTDPDIVTVDEFGRIAAGRPGNAVIWAIYGRGKLRTPINVVVERPRVATPVASLREGTYLKKREAGFKSSTPGSVIRYTMGKNGEEIEDPVSTGKILNGTIQLGEDGKKTSYEIRTIATLDQYDKSEVLKTKYVIDLRNAIEKIDLSDIELVPGKRFPEVSSNTEGVELKDITWNKVTSEGKELAGSTVETGAKYELSGKIAVSDTESSRFSEDTFVTGAESSMESDEELSFSMPLSADDSGSVDSVSIDGITQPAKGEAFDKELNLAGNEVSMDTASWASSEGADVTDGTAEAGKEYRLTVRATTSGNRVFGEGIKSGIKVKKNGEWVNVPESDVKLNGDRTLDVTITIRAKLVAVKDTSDAITLSGSLSTYPNGTAKSKILSDLSKIKAVVKLEDGTERRIDVRWEDLNYNEDTVQASEFGVEGRFSFPEDVDPNGVNPRVSIGVKVSQGKVQAPVLTPGEGIYKQDQVFRLSSATRGAGIVYRTSEENVDITDGSPIEISTPDGTKKIVTIKAYAVKNGIRSEIKTFVVTIDKTVHIDPATDASKNSINAITPTDSAANAAKENKSIGGVVTGNITTSGNIKKKQMTIKWGAVSGAANYRIAYRKAGAKNWNYVWSKGATSYTFKGQKKGSMLEFKQAVYKVVDGEWQRGPWSAENYRYMETVKLKVTKGKKKATVKLGKVKGSSGYEIIHSMKKNMTKAKIGKLKGWKKVKGVVKKLKSKKTYYFKARPYKKYKGKTYIGILCKTKKVKIK